jgi:hypothetical protein
MRGYQMQSTWGRLAGIGGLGALMFTYACGGTQNPAAVRAQEVAGAQNGSPVVVTCEPNQRTLVRSALVNGAAVSQVECVSTGQALASAEPAPAQPAAIPVSSRYAAPRAASRVRTVSDEELGDTRVIPASSDPVTTARPVRAQEVVYDDRPVRRERPARSVRSATKSAVIIGSSAGAGAGVGAAIGGKKGALIGAVLGGGGATLWDQMTRRRN